MASPSQLHAALTLDEFLRLPEIDEHPYLEFIDGRIEAKVSPQKKHSVIQKRLMMNLDAFSQPRGLGETFPELTDLAELMAPAIRDGQLDSREFSRRALASVDPERAINCPPRTF